MTISCDDVVGKGSLDFLAGLTIFFLVKGLSYILIIALLQELTVFTNLLYVHMGLL